MFFGCLHYQHIAYYQLDYRFLCWHYETLYLFASDTITCCIRFITHPVIFMHNITECPRTQARFWWWKHAVQYEFDALYNIICSTYFSYMRKILHNFVLCVYLKTMVVPKLLCINILRSYKILCFVKMIEPYKQSGQQKLIGRWIHNGVLIS